MIVNKTNALAKKQVSCLWCDGDDLSDTAVISLVNGLIVPNHKWQNQRDRCPTEKQATRQALKKIEAMVEHTLAYFPVALCGSPTRLQRFLNSQNKTLCWFGLVAGLGKKAFFSPAWVHKVVVHKLCYGFTCSGPWRIIRRHYGALRGHRGIVS